MRHFTLMILVAIGLALAAAPTSAPTSNRILATLIIRLALINCAACGHRSREHKRYGARYRWISMRSP